MKFSRSDLDLLSELFEKQTALAAARKQLQQLASGVELENQRAEILKQSQLVIDQRSKTEELEREISRIAGDLKLVEERIRKDQDRLQASSSTKDITGIQHELETLAKRKDDLETAELEMLESLEQETSSLAQLSEHKRKLEELFQTDKSFNQERQKLVQAEILALDNHCQKLRAEANPDLLAIFDQRASRGVPIGKLKGSSCGACNMSLNSQDVAALSKLAADELARCPECSAILVRA